MSIAKELIKKSYHFRVYLKTTIKENHGSLNKFCNNSPYDYSDLYKFLNGERDWGVAKVLRLIEILNLQLRIGPIKTPINEAVSNEKISDTAINKKINDAAINEEINDVAINEEIGDTAINEEIDEVDTTTDFKPINIA